MFKPAVSLMLPVLLVLLVPGAARAGAPSPLGGPYLFFGGGLGLQTTADTSGIAITPRWGPTIELGGDLGPLNAAVGADLRILVADFGPSCCAPFDLDVIAAIGLILPTPIVRPFLRLRGGMGWRITPGATSGPAPVSFILAPDLGLRFRLPGTKAAFQIAVGVGPRFVPGDIKTSALEAELRLGLKVP